MTMSKLDIQALSKIAEAAACDAGRITMSYFKGEIEVSHKPGTSNLSSQVLTKADLDSYQWIRKALQPSIEKFNLGFLGEESPDDGSRFGKDYFWCVDPLDGTLPFIEGQHGFAVSIALVEKNGTPVLGIVYDPLKDRVYSSLSENIAPMSPKTFVWYQDRSMSSESAFSDVKTFLETLAHELGCTDLVVENKKGAVLNACGVLDNSYSCYFKLPKSEPGGGAIWDFAATASLFRERYFATDLKGQPLPLNGRSLYLNECGVLFASHAKVFQAIRDYFSGDL